MRRKIALGGCRDKDILLGAVGIAVVLLDRSADGNYPAAGKLHVAESDLGQIGSGAAFDFKNITGSDSAAAGISLDKHDRSGMCVAVVGGVYILPVCPDDLIEGVRDIAG